VTDSRLYQAVDSGWAHIGGEDVLIQAGQIAHGDHPVMKSHGHLFEPLAVDFDLPAAGPAESEQAPKAATGKAAKPAAKGTSPA
jgi:hypothetical protein